MATNFTTSYDSANANYVITDLTPDRLNAQYYGNKLIELRYGATVFDTIIRPRSEYVTTIPVANWPAAALLELEVSMTYYIGDTSVDIADHIYAAPTTLNTKIQ